MANPYGLQVGLATMLAQAAGRASGGQGASGAAKSRPAPVQVPLDEARSLRVVIGNAIGNPRWHEEFGKFFTPPSVENQGVVRDQRGIVQYRLRAAEGSGLRGELTLQRREDGRYRLLVNGREITGVVFTYDPKNQRFFLLEGDQGAIKNALADLRASADQPSETGPPSETGAPKSSPSFVKPRYLAMSGTGTGSASGSDDTAGQAPTEAAQKPDSAQGGSLLETLLPILVMSMLAGRGGNASNAQSLPSIFVV